MKLPRPLRQSLNEPQPRDLLLYNADWLAELLPDVWFLTQPTATRKRAA
jgi:hypothetical protein